MTRLGKALWLAIGAAVLLRLLLMAWLPLTDPAEGRYGEIGRKMAELGDWITPWHQNGMPFWGKPPLSFWMTALSLKALGTNEFAARMPHFLAGVATAACLWNVARAQGAHIGAIAAGVLGTGLLFFLSSGAVMTDAALVLGTTLATTGAWLAMSSPIPDQRRLHSWLAFLGGALGILAKGPLALLLVGAPLLLWATWCGRWRALWEALPWIRGLAMMVALSAPWFFAAESKTPGFFEYFFVGEHYQRFVTPGWTGDLYGKAHHEPKGMIWVFAAGACMPWTLVLPVLAVRRWVGGRRSTGDELEPPGVSPLTSGPWAMTAREESRFVMLWALLPLLFFTVSSNIIWTYVLPAMPGLAWWAARWMGQQAEQGLRWACAGVLVAVLAWATLAVVNQGNGRVERSSAKGLVAACEAERLLHPKAEEAGTPRLILVGRRSFSAHFYTRGRTLRVDALSEVGPRWPAAGTCLAVTLDDVAALADAERGAQLVQSLGVHHDRQVWWALPASPDVVNLREAMR